MGDFHSCSIAASGGLQCWGNNGKGSVGDGTTTDRSAPVPVSGLSSGVAQVDGGFEHTCARTTASAAMCWGLNTLGRVGASSGDTCGVVACAKTPTGVTGLGGGVVDISAGANHACAVTSAGGVKCWGNNDYGQLVLR